MMNKKIDIGTFCIGCVAILFLLSFLLSFKYPNVIAISNLLLGGFIGGFTNKIAVKMMFKKYWYLPGSGVLLKRRDDIIRSLADTVEAYIINHELLEEKFREIIEKADDVKIVNAVNALIDEFRDDFLEYVNSTSFHAKIVKIIKEKLGIPGIIFNITGIKDYDVMAHDIQDWLNLKTNNFEFNLIHLRAIIKKSGTLEDFIFKPNNKMMQRHYGETNSLAYFLFREFNVRQIVFDKLAKYPADKIKDIVEQNIKIHLAWLEVFGVILGIIFSSIFLFR